MEYNWKRVGQKSMWIAYFSNGDRAYRSYNTIIGYFSAEENALYVNRNNYSNTTSHHKGIMRRDVGGAEIVDTSHSDVWARYEQSIALCYA